MNGKAAYKSWIFKVALIVVPAVLLVGTANFLIDPLQHFRKASFYKTCFCEEQRYLNPGLAKNFAYDSILVGSSMTENMAPSYIDRKLGMKILKLSLKGASAYEEHLMLDTSIRTGRVRNVLLGVDVFSFEGSPKRLRYGPGSVPLYLYDDTLLNDYMYILSLDTLLNQSRHSIMANIRGVKDQLDMDSAYNWAGSSRFSAAQVWKEWGARGRKKKIDRAQFRFPVLKESFDQNIIPHIRRNKGINFYIFFPPYSIVYWKNMEEIGILEDTLQFNRYVFESTKGFGNVKVFNFQAEDTITFNLDNYKDMNHYSPEVDKFIVDSIAKGVYLMTDENSLGSINRISTQIKEFKPKF